MWQLCRCQCAGAHSAALTSAVWHAGKRRLPHARLTFIDMAGMEPAKDILESQLPMEDIHHLQESNEALHTSLSRHLWLQQGGFKEPLDIPYGSSKVILFLASDHSQ